MLIFSFLLLNMVITLKSRPLNILFVVEYFPARSQIFILNQITGLIDNGHNVSIFSISEGENINQHPNIEKYSLLDRVYYEKMPTVLPECDIIFCQSGSLGNKLFRFPELKEWLEDKKIVVCLRGHDITSNNVKQDKERYNYLFKRGDLFLPVCDYFKRLLIKFNCDPEKIVVHHSAINCSQFFFKERRKPKEGLIRLVSVCRLIEKKGMRYAIKAIARVIKKYKNIHFTIIGDGPLKEELEKLIKNLKIRNYVTLFGWSTHDQIAHMLDQSHIFLLPSVTAENGDEEGIANALKEAMAMGLISIATWHAGNPELIDDLVSGFLVPEKSSKLLARKIKYIINNPDQWESIGHAARKKIEDEFETKQSIIELEELFYGLLDL